jgi:hypothetical protein
VRLQRKGGKAGPKADRLVQEIALVEVRHVTRFRTVEMVVEDVAAGREVVNLLEHVRMARGSEKAFPRAGGDPMMAAFGTSVMAPAIQSPIATSSRKRTGWRRRFRACVRPARVRVRRTAASTHHARTAPDRCIENEHSNRVQMASGGLCYLLSDRIFKKDIVTNIGTD